MTIISTYSVLTEYPSKKLYTLYLKNIMGEGNTVQFKYNIPVWGDWKNFLAIILKSLAIMEIGF